MRNPFFDDFQKSGIGIIRGLFSFRQKMIVGKASVVEKRNNLVEIGFFFRKMVKNIDFPVIMIDYNHISKNLKMNDRYVPGLFFQRSIFEIRRSIVSDMAK